MVIRGGPPLQVLRCPLNYCPPHLFLSGLAAHLEKIDLLEPFFTPLYFNYMEYARQLKREARSEGFDDMVRLA